MTSMTIADNFRGLTEGQLAQFSGLRNRTFTGMMLSDQDLVCASQTVGGASGADVLTWQTLTVAANPIPTWPCTLVALVNQAASPVAGTIALRVKGYDQFGMPQTEVTPFAAVANKANTYVYLAKVFSLITSVEWQSTSLDAANSTVELGTRFDWTRTIDASNEHVAGVNLGLGLPLQVQKKVYQGKMLNPPAPTAGLRLGVPSALDDFEVSCLTVRDITGGATSVVFQPPIGETDSNGWEGSLDKIRLTAAGSWAVTDLVRITVTMFTKADTSA